MAMREQDGTLVSTSVDSDQPDPAPEEGSEELPEDEDDSTYRERHHDEPTS